MKYKVFLLFFSLTSRIKSPVTMLSGDFRGHHSNSVSDLNQNNDRCLQSCGLSLEDGQAYFLIFPFQKSQRFVGIGANKPSVTSLWLTSVLPILGLRPFGAYVLKELKNGFDLIGKPTLSCQIPKFSTPLSINKFITA